MSIVRRDRNKNKKGGIIITVLLIILVVFLLSVFVSDKKTTKQENNKTIKQESNEEKQKSSNPKRNEKLDSQSIEVEEKNILDDIKPDETLEKIKEPISENNIQEEINVAKTEIENTLEILESLFSKEVKEESESMIPFEEINQLVRKSLVNVLCTSKTGGYLNPLSGSGVIIDERGVILTNAHVAQYYLLENYLTEDFITCTIRMGSPSRALYKAELMYISDSWIKSSYENIIKDNYTQSGEHDYAFLKITEPVSDEIKLPEKFDFVSLADNSISIKPNDNVVIGGYPAGFLGGISIQKNLYTSTTIEQVSEVFTFKENTLDIISLGGSILAQKGSSGGAVVNNEANLIAIPVTSTDSEQTDERDLRAITVSHIDRSLKQETGEGIKGMLSYDPTLVVNLFRSNKFEELKSFLVKALEM